MPRGRSKRSTTSTTRKIDQMLSSTQSRANNANHEQANRIQPNDAEANTASQTSDSSTTSATDNDPSSKEMSFGDYATFVNEIRGMYREHQENIHRVGADVTSIKDSMDSLKTDVANLGTRIGEAEERVSNLEDGQASLADITTGLSARVVQLETRMQYLENYSRRNNLRIKGIPESTEREGKVIDCVKNVLHSLFPDTVEVNDIVIERAHRVPMARPRDGQVRSAPRHILVRFLSYRDREKVRLRARDLGTFHWNGIKVDFFPDFTKEVQDKRSKFTEVRHLCMRKGLRYTLQYPAVLWVTIDGVRQRFEDPVAAKRSVNNYQPPNNGE